MLKFLESFDLAADEGYFDAAYGTRTGTLDATTPNPAGREQGNAAQANSNTALELTTKALVGSPSNTWFTGIGVQFIDAAGLATGLTAWQGISFMSGATEQCSLDFIPANTDAGNFVLIQARRGATILGTTTVGITPQFWYYVECNVVARTGTNGSIEIKMGFRNNATTAVLTLTGINTANLGSDGIDRMKLRWSTSGAALGNRVAFDDWYICDNTTGTNNTYLGPTTILGLIPNGTGATQQWSLAGGAPSIQVALQDTFNSATTPGDDSRITAETIGQIALASYPNSTYLANTTVRGIMVRSRAGMDTTGTRTIKHRLRNTSTATETDGSLSFVLSGTAWAEYSEVFEVDPNTSVAWTKTGLDALELGARVTA